MIYQIWVLILASAQLLSLPAICFLAFFHEPSGRLEQWSIQWGEFSANGQSLILAFGVLLFLSGLITLRMATPRRVSRMRDAFAHYISKDVLERLLEEDAVRNSAPPRSSTPRPSIRNLIATNLGAIQVVGLVVVTALLLIQLAWLNGWIF